MAGFFSLGSGRASGSGRETPTPHQQQNQTNPDNNNNNNPNWATNPGLLLYRNEEIYQKGFEIWQQYVQVHHHHHHHHPHPKQLLHQDHPHPLIHPALYLGGGDQMAGPSSSSGGGARPSSSGSRVMMRVGGSGSGGGGINCQDCGNQAKKDCSHMRCRTCCKSRGFDCATHVKSTWVPAAKRRERQQQQVLSLQQHQQIQDQLVIGMREKRQRDADANANTSNNNAVASRMGASSAGLEVGQHFPPEVSSPAVFRCVRVHSVDNADEQLAYQTAVNVGGHLFKGILYDQGPESTHYPPVAGDSSSGGEPSGATPLHHHNLLSSAPAPASDPENTGGSGGATCEDPNAIYPPPISAFLAGTQFFPPPRS